MAGETEVNSVFLFLIKEYLLYMLVHLASGWMLFRGRWAHQDK